MFIAIPVGMNYRTERLPVVTFTLIGINTLVWLVSAICLLSTEGESLVWELHHLWLVPASCTWYAPITHMFVHAGSLHLAGNMIFLFLFGACVEDIIGRLRFAAFYLLGGLMAAFFYILLSPEHFQSTLPMGGASGAIGACMGMYLLLRADADIEIKYFLWLFVYIRAGGFEIPAWVAIIFWFVCQLVSAALELLLGSGHEGGVAFGAHIGGFLGGLALIGIYRRGSHPRAEEPAKPRLIIDPAALAAAVRAPLTSPVTSETPTIFLHDGSQQTGPFTLTDVQARLQRGEISREASYWSEGMADWQSVMDLAGQPLE
jgi:membrane associated rhomboid family serine protease